jgi:hypothetical protein
LLDVAEPFNPAIEILSRQRATVPKPAEATFVPGAAAATIAAAGEDILDREPSVATAILATVSQRTALAGLILTVGIAGIRLVSALVAAASR